jgi:hypothetical protein
VICSSAADNMVSKTINLFMQIEDDEPCILNCRNSDTFETVLGRVHATGVYRVTHLDDGSRHVVRDLITKYHKLEENGLYVLAIPVLW